ncbi:MAG: DNA methyltransferase, partial [Candidatus Woykebacteria bacterium]
MNKQAAINLVQSTFERPYHRDRFLTFAKNLFHTFETSTFIYRGNYIPDAYKKQIKTLERIGKYEDSEGNKIDILAVCISQETTLERARTLQRNFISWYLNGSRGDVTKDAALVAFYVDGSHDWRLSLVKMEYRLDKSESGRLKTFTELTPAKRFSFFVGEGENTHTAQRQLLPVLLREDVPPSLSDLEKAFSVEVVTKEFFEKYKQLFLDTKEALDKILKSNPQIQSDFQDKNIDTVDFTKKLLGQIVFLYFLQKKGWFGVSRDEDWGTGPREFLRLLFEKNITDYDNYFNDILEPLFYEALAIERPDDFYSRFNCKIPFLNGGLFDPLNNYDWVHTDIHLPNYLFSNDKLTKEGDKGTGILDVFDRYNFTVKEDEPLEKEVAVDPEMLGKVFENLLEVKDRKSKGTYYTPREIVHYMCQESLVNYLVTELDGKVEKEDIETLIQIGEAAVEHDTQVTALGTETETYSYKLPSSVRQNAKAIDEALVNIRVCDPAVGSGAFLVGMMTEIIRVRNTISSYLVDGDRSIYTFKHHAIQNSLYGVDIDPGATEIAKLRLWLSLIVDEQDIKRIKPLPNLDYKIMQGNSLLEEYEGIKLFDEELFTKSIFDNTAQIAEIKTKMSELQREFFELYKKNEFQGIRKQQIEAELKKYSDRLKKLTKTPKPQVENGSLFDQVSEAQQKAKELKRLQREFFDTAHKMEKDRIKKQIEALTWEFIEATLREQGKESLMREVEKF